MVRPARKFIDTEALRANYRELKTLCAPARVLAVVKCEAYGHGMLRAARALAAADGFCVATVNEGIALRDAEVDNVIIVLQGFHNAEELRAAAACRLVPVIHSYKQISCLKQNSVPDDLELWVKFDTGMHRLGLPPQSAPEIMRFLFELKLNRAPVLMSHFACADEADMPGCEDQQHTFEAIRRTYACEASMANSAACLRLPGTRYQWVRSGIALYGSVPEAASEYQPRFKPVMTLTAPLIALRQCRAGDAVGYGMRYVCPSDMRVGVVAVGYGDGYLRSAPSGTPVWVGGQRQHLLGRVSMDMITVSLSDTDISVGERVELWGSNIPVAEVARHCGTISYELLTAARDIPDADEEAESP